MSFLPDMAKCTPTELRRCVKNAGKSSENCMHTCRSWISKTGGSWAFLRHVPGRIAAGESIRIRPCFSLKRKRRQQSAMPGRSPLDGCFVWSAGEGACMLQSSGNRRFGRRWPAFFAPFFLHPSFSGRIGWDGRQNAPCERMVLSYGSKSALRRRIYGSLHSLAGLRHGAANGSLRQYLWHGFSV